MATLEDLPPVAGRRVLVRADLNAPLRQTGSGAYEVSDDFRLRASVPTLAWLVEHGAHVSVCSHLGRPKGKVDARYAMTPVRERMATLAPGVEVMENLRFDPGEEANDRAFVRRLVEGFDFFVNDAFGACHRRHASIVGPPTLLPSVAGRSLESDLNALSRLLINPQRPFVAVLGGAKVADKLGLLTSLSQKVDRLYLGGAMSFTFLAATGHDVGTSPVEPTLFDDARVLLARGQLQLPTDIVALSPDGSFAIGASPSGTSRTFGIDLLPGWQGGDIGPATRASFGEGIARAGTVLWNGPMGVFEDPRYGEGTRSIAQAVASGHGFSVVGGGETAAAVHAFHLEHGIDHVSSGGGATLEFIEKGDLPGLAALRASVSVAIR
jgi:phosphoglycerate kinase